MGNKLEILRSNIKEIWSTGMNHELEVSYFHIKHSRNIVPDIPDPDLIYTGFVKSSSKLEDLEVIICNWRAITLHSSFVLGDDTATFIKYQTIRDTFKVQSLRGINLKHIIMSSDLSQHEKEYLRLKYFI